MKKLNLFFSIMMLITFVLASCSKDDDSEPTFDKNKLIGVWEMTGGDDFIACPDGNNKLLTITDSTFIEGFTDNDGCDNGSFFEFNYDYVYGNTFDVYLGTYKVTSLKNNVMTMVVTYLFDDEVSYNWTFEKK